MQTTPAFSNAMHMLLDLDKKIQDKPIMFGSYTAIIM